MARNCGCPAATASPSTCSTPAPGSSSTGSGWGRAPTACACSPSPAASVWGIPATSVDPQILVILAVDIGGTKLAAGLVDPADGRILARAVTPTPRSGDAEAVFAALVGLLERLGPGRAAAEACGIGSGGPMSSGGETLTPVHIPAWRAFPLRRRMAEATGLPVFVDNDAKAVALAEGWVGAAAGVEGYIGMVVSTGIGGGIVLDGRLLDGRAGNAGHIGHVVVEPGGRRCFCGGQGCLEGEASGRAIEAVTGRPPAEAGPDVVARTGMLVGRAVAS